MIMIPTSKMVPKQDIRTPPKPPTNNAMYHPSRYKIELCFQFMETGYCQFGDRCLYAHGKFELRPCTYRHQKFKTQLCKAFHEDGFCSFGNRCSFIHTQPNLDGLLKRLDDSMMVKTEPMPGEFDRAQLTQVFYLLEASISVRKTTVLKDIEDDSNLLPSPFEDFSYRLPCFIQITSNNFLA